MIDVANVNQTQSTLEAAAGAAGPHATEAFALLGNETRLAILLALWEAYDPRADDDAVPFSELYDRVDYDDPGNFSYHLEKLEGQFIQQASEDEGYELRGAGLNLIQTIIAGAGASDTTLDTAEIDRDCWRCGAPTAVMYQDGVLYQVCTDCEGITTKGTTPDGFLNGMRLDPAGLIDREPEELLAAAAVAAYRHMRTMLEGLCSACSGPVDTALETCADHDPEGICDSCGRTHAIWTRFQCRVCKDQHCTTPTMLAMFHPAVTAFYYDHDISIQWRVDEFETVKQTLELVTNHHEMALSSEDPLRATVTVSLDGDQCRLIYDETARVVDVRD